MSLTPPIKLAILDDYHNIAAPHFAHIDKSKLHITTFTDTLPAYSHPSTSDADRAALIARLQPFSVLSTMRERTPLTSDLLQHLPNLKLILATGDGAGTQSPRALPVKQGGGHPTTQHAWALILALARNVAADDAAVKAGGWQTDLAIGLPGKTLGLVGLGRLGSHVARVGVLAFGMKIVCWSANLTQEKADAMAHEVGLPVTGGGMAEEGEKTFRVVSKEEVFGSADVVSVHYVLSERSRGLVGKRELACMKTSGLLVNTSRGPLVDEAALLDTLRHGRIRGAALDVFDIEPLPADSPWRSEDWNVKGKSRVLLTPHMGYVEEGTMGVWYEETVENVERLIEGRELLHVIT
ncbi:hypothetical protein SNOG_01032 [Parastagonospora nodorum SN15]|uniref:D-isomer specific 2-hydroxyacid dehydrogenase NAD-binding domain-containing protein n=1 Tax=Phaeosphaeria nodorum (strain SN15 / ATCC MYA-4574 / FGSC 10173) TaxID=321614 RepID=Q0V4N2_PHANO|nr:hypothetical protein SNOG_01032 [Parastagonospora nodorum SN15]EAT92527.2 hypothetical protein SNOG_01032 [Parastagonospora nodorum SN15]